MTEQNQHNVKDQSNNKRSKAASITLRILKALIIPFLICVLFLTGLILGYHNLGGGSVSSVFHWGTWQHMIDLVFSGS